MTQIIFNAQGSHFNYLLSFRGNSHCCQRFLFLIFLFVHRSTGYGYCFFILNFLFCSKYAKKYTVVAFENKAKELEYDDLYNPEQDSVSSFSNESKPDLSKNINSLPDFSDRFSKRPLIQNELKTTEARQETNDTDGTLIANNIKKKMSRVVT